jgi:membrane-associated phospholipid phosphatase
MKQTFLDFLINLRDYIGVYAPILLFILTLFLLRNKITFLKYFLAGFFFNILLNIFLKIIIQQPRPDGDLTKIEFMYNNNKQRITFDKFGMPSGHAQSCAFILSFLTLTLTNFNITSFVLFLSILSMFQRYLYNNHTIFQLIVGFFIGIGMGYLFYTLSQRHIMGKIKHKKDDQSFLYQTL